MRNSLIAVLIVALIALPTISIAGTINDVTISGYFAVDAPMHDGETYKPRWARIKFVGVPSLQRNVSVVTEWDFATMSSSYLYTKIKDSLFGGVASATVGKVLSPIGSLMPASNSIKTIRWEHAYDAYSIYPFGLLANFSKGRFNLNLLHAENSMAVVTAYGVSAFWQEDAGYGFTTKLPFVPAFAESRVTASFPEEGMEQVSVLTCINPSGKLTFNYIADIGYVNALTFGFAYEYSDKSFVKAYFDIESGGYGEFDLELVCSF